MNGALAVRLWFNTWLVLSAGFIVAGIFIALMNGVEFYFVLLACAAAFAGSLPALVFISVAFYVARRYSLSPRHNLYTLLAICFAACCPYGVLAGLIYGSHNLPEGILAAIGCTLVLFGCFVVAFFIRYKYIRDALLLTSHLPQLKNENAGDTAAVNILFLEEDSIKNKSITINTHKQMDSNQPISEAMNEPLPSSSANKIMIKAAITGALILLMLIPMIFINNLVREREQRQQEVVTEVSDKWARPQSVSTPYLVIPYEYTYLNQKKEAEKATKDIILLPEVLNVKGVLVPQERKRSIYTVLLYQAALKTSGHFLIKIPSTIKGENLLWKDARLCLGITDFKGINKQVTANFGSNIYELTPGLPTSAIDKDGLSAPVVLSGSDIGKPLNFNLDLDINGSQQLQFIPLAGNSNFSLHSTWANPSFDGITLPFSRQVSDSGFTAQWSFNKARLPFGTFLNDFKMDKTSYSFGVSMVQPADQYAKTSRSVKYAILFIGLTFSIFFIVELMQKRPVHPVQYILVGLALVIFYTLLLSLSELVLFDIAYLAAASATILLISLYAKGHFKSWKVAGIFAGVLSMLYSFIFVLIRLEDTSLLVGSVGLFAVLALVMYASRRINWYQPSFGKTLNA